MQDSYADEYLYTKRSGEIIKKWKESHALQKCMPLIKYDTYRL